MSPAPGSGSLAELLFRHAGQQADCYQVVRLPRLPRGRMLSQLTSPLIGAFQLGSKVFAAWSHEAAGPFTVHVGGTHGFPAWVDGGSPVGGMLFPPGAEAIRRGAAGATLGRRLTETPYWLRIGAVVSPERAPPPADAGGGALPSMPATPTIEALEDHASFLADRAFELLCIAIPVPAEEADQGRSRLSSAIFAIEQQLERGVANLALAQLRSQLAEYAAAATVGLWRVHAFVGAPDQPTTRQVAALWCAATTGHGTVPYRLAPLGAVGDLRTVVAAAHPGSAAAAPGTELTGPFTVGSAMLAALCRPPLQELPGVVARATNPFDVAVEPEPGEVAAPREAGESAALGELAAQSAQPVPFGQILDAASRPVGTLSVPLRSLGLHTFVHGATGAGKSQATRHLLTELSRRGIPWVVLEPAKSEYATGMQERLAAIRDELPDPMLAEVHLVRPGDPAATPVCLPPLQPEPGFSYQAHLDLLVDLAVAAFDADSPFPEVLTQAVELAVREAGWDAALSQPLRALAERYPSGQQPAYPEVADLIRCCHEVIDAKGYGREVAGNVHGFVDMRLGTLTTGTKRTAFSAGYPLSMTRLLHRNVVLELQDLGTDSDRALFMGLFLARLSQAVRLRHRADPREGVVRNVVCVEEAHRLLRNPQGLTGAAARAVGSFTDLLAEVRSQGVALIVAEQIPAKLAPDVVKNTAVKCMGRTPAADDRALVGASIGLDEAQSLQVVALRAGTFAVHADGYDRPVLVRFPYRAETGATRPYDPAPLVDALPPWYGPAAEPGRLTQRELAWAAECARQPRLVAICELTVAAYLAHQVPPQPDRALRRALVAPFAAPPPPVGAAAARRSVTAVAGDGVAGSAGPGESSGVSAGAMAVDAAIGMLTAHAVRARRSVLGPYPAEELTTAVAAAVRAALSGVPVSPGPPDPRWRSRPHQWLSIRAALASGKDDEPAHPDTERWRGWGVDYVAGATIGEQRISLLSSVLHRRDDLVVALLGQHRPGGLEQAVLASGLPFGAGLEQLLRAFVNLPALAGLRQALIRHGKAGPGSPRRRPASTTVSGDPGASDPAGSERGRGNPGLSDPDQSEDSDGQHGQRR